jgi:hypothetical protein
MSKVVVWVARLGGPSGWPVWVAVWVAGPPLLNGLGNDLRAGIAAQLPRRSYRGAP